MRMEHDCYTIDSGMSRLTVRAFASGMFSALGHNPTLGFRNVTGEACFVPETFHGASLHVRIDAGSLMVVDRISERDRNEIERTVNRDVLETEKYPEIVFVSSKVSASKAGEGQYWVNLVGDLLLHGVTGAQSFAAQIAVSDDTLQAHGEFAVLQTAYKIRPVSVANGALKLKDELKCSFDIVARKQLAKRETQQNKIVVREVS